LPEVLIAFYENDIPFELRMLAPDNPQAVAEHAALWPLKRMPCWWTTGARSSRRASSSNTSRSIIPVRCA